MAYRATGRHLVFITALLLFAPSALGLGTTVLDGDVYIQMIGTVHESTESGTCSSQVDAQSVQNMEAVRWLLKTLNGAGTSHYLPGLTTGIGLRVAETCGSVTRAEDLALQLAIELEEGTSSDVIGVIGPGGSGSEAVSRLLSAVSPQHRLLQLDYSATSTSQGDRDTYRNVFTTLPDDDVQIQAMYDLLKRLRWTYVAIIYEDTEHGRRLKDALVKEKGSRDICFPVELGVNTATSTTDSLADTLQEEMINSSIPVRGAVVLGNRKFADDVMVAIELALQDFPDTSPPVLVFSDGSRYIEGTDNPLTQGGYVLSPPKRDIQDFQDHWRDLQLSNTDIDALPQPYRSWVIAANGGAPSVYNQYAVQAALVIAKAAKTVCQASGCDKLTTVPKQTFIDAMVGLTIDFDNDYYGLIIRAFRNPDLVVTFSEAVGASRQAGLPLYEAYNFQKCAGNTCLDRVAYLTSEKFVFDSAAIRDYDKDGQELVWPDIRKAQCPDGFSCDACYHGNMPHDDGFVFEEGDLYIVGMAPVHNIGESPLQCGDIKAGSVDVVETIRFAIEDAASSIPNFIPKGKIGVYIIDSCNDAHIIQEKIMNLNRYGVLINGEYLPIADKIIGYIGGWSSDVSTATVSITTRLGVVQIAYASTAPRLSNTYLYPYFLRTPTPDDAQADTLLSIVQHFGSDLIQILYSETAYGEGGRDAVMERAAELGVCVAQAVGVKRSDNYAHIIAALRAHAGASVVICFLGSFESEPLAQSLNDNLDKNEFTFVGTEGWGTRVDVSELPNLVGSMTLTLELPVNEKFKNHLKAQDPAADTGNPWLAEYMEDQFNCYYEWSMNKLDGQPCSSSTRLDVFSTAYNIDVFSGFAERAVLSLLQGARRTLDRLCGDSWTVCPEYRDSPDILFTETSLIETKDETGTTTSRIYDDSGDGEAGYIIFVVDDDNKYRRIGTKGAKFTFDDSLYPASSHVNSTCGNQPYCKICFPSAPTPEEVKDESPVVWIALVSVLALICLILALFVCCCCRRHGCCITKEESGWRLDVYGYINPVHGREPRERPDGDEKKDDYDKIAAPDNVYMTPLPSHDQPPVQALPTTTMNRPAVRPDEQEMMPPPPGLHRPADPGPRPGPPSCDKLEVTPNYLSF